MASTKLSRRMAPLLRLTKGPRCPRCGERRRLISVEVPPPADLPKPRDPVAGDAWDPWDSTQLGEPRCEACGIQEWQEKLRSPEWQAARRKAIRGLEVARKAAEAARAAEVGAVKSLVPGGGRIEDHVQDLVTDGADKQRVYEAVEAIYRGRGKGKSWVMDRATRLLNSRAMRAHVAGLRSRGITALGKFRRPKQAPLPKAARLLLRAIVNDAMGKSRTR